MSDKATRVDWLLDSTPREVQLEALRRSYYGYKLRDGINAEPVYRRLGPDYKWGWNHYLEMRLGKTSTALNEFCLFERDRDYKRLVVVAPNSFKQGWVDEAQSVGLLFPWLVYDARYQKTIRKEIEAMGDETNAMVINYEAIRNSSGYDMVSDFMDGHPTMVVFDESIRLKGHSSSQTKAAINLTKHDEVLAVRNLSGLPFTQGPHDLWGQMRAIGRISGVNYFTFRNRYCKMGGFKNKKVMGVRDPDALAEFMHENSFVARKADWGNSATPNHYVLKSQLTSKQQAHYDSMDKEFVTMLESGEEISVDVIVSKIQKLAQISSGFLYHEGEMHEIEDPRKVPKMAQLVDMLQETRDKTIVCYHYSATGDALLDALRGYNPATIRAQGWMTKNKIDVESEKRRFNHDPECRVMVLQISAGKYGHNLSGNPQDRCTNMVFYENTYSLDDRTQVEMRNTGAFQDWHNDYHDLVSSKVEANVIKALRGKSDMKEAIMKAYFSDDALLDLLET